MNVLQNIVMYSSILFQNAFEISFFRNGFRKPSLKKNGSYSIE